MFNILKELIGNEESYIRSLNEGISGYMNNFDQIDMPSSLRGQKYRVFGNIERIKEFHEKYFYPALAECNLDIVKICNTFCEFIDVCIATQFEANLMTFLISKITLELIRHSIKIFYMHFRCPINITRLITIHAERLFLYLRTVYDKSPKIG